MSGPEHYREAERLLDGPDNISDPDEFERLRADNLAAAQAHATLALAAATIDAAAHPNQSQVDYLGRWWEAGV